LAGTALWAHGHPVHPRLIRALFDAIHVCTNDDGNQWIGDALGAHGLHLRRDQHGNYAWPEDGIGPEDIILHFWAPLGYPWDTDSEKYFAAAAALPPTAIRTPTTPALPALPHAEPARPDSQVAGTDQDRGAGAGLSGKPTISAADAGIGPPVVDRSRLGKFSMLIRGSLAKLREVVRLLRAHAAVCDGDLVEVEALLREVESCIGEAADIADELAPPRSRVARRPQ